MIERYTALLKEKYKIHDPLILKQRMLEKIMVAAFGSDGGLMLHYGDEYGIEQRLMFINPELLN